MSDDLRSLEAIREAAQEIHGDLRHGFSTTVMRGRKTDCIMVLVAELDRLSRKLANLADCITDLTVHLG